MSIEVASLNDHVATCSLGNLNSLGRILIDIRDISGFPACLPQSKLLSEMRIRLECRLFEVIVEYDRISCSKRRTIISASLSPEQNTAYSGLPQSLRPTSVSSHSLDQSHCWLAHWLTYG
jgi:hypothetical protein